MSVILILQGSLKYRHPYNIQNRLIYHSCLWPPRSPTFKLQRWIIYIYISSRINNYVPYELV